VAITVHDIVPYLVRHDPAQNVYPHFYDRLVDERAMKNICKAERIIAISAYTGQMLVEKLGCPPDRIRVVPLGIDPELFHPVEVSAEFRRRYGLEPGRRYLLYVGSENPRKNLPRLVQALAIVRRKMPRVSLIKVGTPEHLTHYELLKNQIHAAGLDDAFLFIGHVTQEDLASLYSAADAFVFPSLYEGFGLPPLEAMACGAPVICSNTASLPEVVGDAAIMLDPYDIDAWANAILQVLEDDALRQELCSRSLARAAQFTWERTVQQTIRVYQEVDGTG
jgi:glycosyltransferase involved in cell wall biosynthesis